MCVFSMKSIDLELALIDHIPFPFSVTPPVPPHPPPFLHHDCTLTHLFPPCPGHLSDSARELSVPAGVRATERPLCPRRPYSGISVPLRAVVAHAHTHTHTHVTVDKA